MTPDANKKIIEIDNAITNVNAGINELKHQNKQNDRTMIVMAISTIASTAIAKVLDIIKQTNPKSDHNIAIQIFAAMALLGFAGYAFGLINDKLIGKEIKQLQSKREKLQYEQMTHKER